LINDVETSGRLSSEALVFFCAASRQRRLCSTLSLAGFSLSETSSSVGGSLVASENLDRALPRPSIVINATVDSTKPVKGVSEAVDDAALDVKPMLPTSASTSGGGAPVALLLVVVSTPGSFSVTSATEPPASSGKTSACDVGIALAADDITESAESVETADPVSNLPPVCPPAPSNNLETAITPSDEPAESDDKLVEVDRRDSSFTSDSEVGSLFPLSPVEVRRNVTFVGWVTDDVSTREGVDAVVVVSSVTSEVGNDSGTVMVFAVVDAMPGSVVDSSFGLWSLEVNRNVTFVGWVTDDVSTREVVGVLLLVCSVTSEVDNDSGTVEVLSVVGAMPGLLVDSSFGLWSLEVKPNVTFVGWVTDDVSTREEVDAVVVVCSVTSEVGNDSGTAVVVAVVGAMLGSVVDSSFGLWSLEVNRNVTFVGWVTDDVSTREGVDALLLVCCVPSVVGSDSGSVVVSPVVGAISGSVVDSSFGLWPVEVRRNVTFVDWVTDDVSTREGVDALLLVCCVPSVVGSDSGSVVVSPVVGAMPGSVVDSSFGLWSLEVKPNVTFVGWMTDDVSTTEEVDAVVVVCSVTSEVGNDSGTVVVLSVVGAMLGSVVDSSFGLWSVKVTRNVTFVDCVTDDDSTREGVDAVVVVCSVTSEVGNDSGTAVVVAVVGAMLGSVVDSSFGLWSLEVNRNATFVGWVTDDVSTTEGVDVLLLVCCVPSVVGSDSGSVVVSPVVGAMSGSVVDSSFGFWPVEVRRNVTFVDWVTDDASTRVGVDVLMFVCSLTSEVGNDSGTAVDLAVIGAMLGSVVDSSFGLWSLEVKPNVTFVGWVTDDVSTRVGVDGLMFACGLTSEVGNDSETVVVFAVLGAMTGAVVDSSFGLWPVEVRRNVTYVGWVTDDVSTREGVDVLLLVCCVPSAVGSDSGSVVVSPVVGEMYGSVVDSSFGFWSVEVRRNVTFVGWVTDDVSTTEGVDVLVLVCSVTAEVGNDSGTVVAFAVVGTLPGSVVDSSCGLWSLEVNRNVTFVGWLTEDVSTREGVDAVVVVCSLSSEVGNNSGTVVSVPVAGAMLGSVVDSALGL
jgi:hypothetical protein